MQLTFLSLCADCGAPAASKRNIGGLLQKRCLSCALAAERDDLAAQFGTRYAYADGAHWLDGRRVGYIEALGLLGGREQDEQVAA